MIIAFLYDEHVARTEGGCGDIVGTFEDEPSALRHCLTLLDGEDSDISYVDLLITNQGRGPYVNHYSKRRDDAHFIFRTGYPVSSFTYRAADGGDESPY